MQESPFHIDKGVVRHFNFVNEVRSAVKLPENVVICDMTLREGEHGAGVEISDELRSTLIKPVSAEIGAITLQTKSCL